MSTTSENLTPLKRALLTLDKMQKKLDEYERRSNEPIAIVGIGCRAPGGVHDAESFWQLLRNGVDAITEVPQERWNLNEHFDADKDAPGKMYTRYGGFLADIDKFDALFFGITPREAVSMDPQQRLLLETSWEALEHAGQTKERLLNSRTGVFMGVCFNEYAQKHLYSGDTTMIDGYCFTGIAQSVLTGRLSYCLGLQGPSLAIDTACSSSLVTVHLACQSLRNRESDMALAGGVNLMLTPENTIYFCKVGAMSPDGRCKTFDAAANGYVRGEGCGVVVLKRLSDALTDGDNILALIRGSAVNQDGRSNGLTAPNGPAQEAVIRAALANANAKPEQVSYIEAHGTGTPLGDPIEVRALGNVYREGRDANAPLFIGSVKTNFGHLEGAAGVMGLIKTVLAMQHEEIPPHLHFKQLNPLISLDEIPARIPTQLTAWPASNGARFAGVSSFGISGTNAHVILQGAKDDNEEKEPNRPLPLASCHLLPLSAHTPEVLQALARSYQSFLPQALSSLPHACFTASVRRSHHEYRIAFAGKDKDELLAQLEAFLKGEKRAGRKESEEARKLAFVFSGQGPQWFAMGRQLLQASSAFRAKIEECDMLLRAHASWSLLEELQREENSSRLDQTEIAQPAIFALQVALAEMWRSWGIVPETVVGHSVGEVAAAHVAGALSLADAVRVIMSRGRSMQRATGLGKMAQVELEMESVRAALQPYRDRLAVAAINSPSTCVIAGEEAALEEVLRTFEARKIEVKRLRVNYAFHSPQMEPFRAELENELRGLQPSATTLPMISTVTGNVIRGEELNANYWGRNVRETVAFAPAIASLLQEHFTTFVEVSPHPVLGAAILQCAAAQKCEATVLASLRRGQDEHATMLKALGALYALGYAVHWKALHPNRGTCIALPSYPWQRQSYWIANDRRAHHATIHDPRATTLEPQSSLPAIADWLYEVQWQSQARRDHRATNARGHWLIISDRVGYGDALAKALVAQGCTCEIILAEDEAAQALQSARAVQGVVHASSLDQTLDVAQASLPANFLHALQTLLGGNPPSRLWIVTKNAQAVNDEPLALNGSTLWGLGRTFALEHPEAWGGLIDLGAHAHEQAAALLAEELLNNDGEDQIAFRADQRFVARLQRAQLASNKEFAVRAERTYLITGGLGSLGLRAATWLAEKGAKHIVLLSRRKFPARADWPQYESQASWREAFATINKLEQAGVQWHVYSVEVSDATRMAEVFNELGTTMPPLAGVIHAAGVSSHKALRALSPEELQATLQPKVQGAWVLHELTRALPLDFFVLYSSISAMWGAKELGHYAAANHFLDALAQYRRRLRLPALSVNWGPWAGGGMASADFVATLARTGIAALHAHEALAALEALLAHETAQMIVAKLQWPRFKDVLELKGSRPLLTEWHAQARATQANADAANDLREQLEQADAVKRFELLTRHIQQEAAKTMGLPVTHALDASQGFFNMGMDSIMAVELKTRLEKLLGVTLPRTVAFEHPSINKLAVHVAEKFFSKPILPTAESSVAINSAAPTVALAEIQNLSEAELAAIVDAELAQLGK